MSSDIVYGLHSIVEALQNKNREGHVLYVTKESLEEIKKNLKKNFLDEAQVIIRDSAKVQEMAEKICKELNFKYQRAPGNMFLKTSLLEISGPEKIFKAIEEKKTIKIICLDQVTDAHNAAAIIRSAAFYGVNYIVFAQKGNFGQGPTLNRISSGAMEHIQLVRCSSLTKFVQKVSSLGVYCVGLSEHADAQLNAPKDESVCLVLGAEDVGISHAVKRIIPHWMSLKPCGKIKSLNVSVASAVAMDRIFTS
ncbi:MAG: RNA methyltransferase [Halobacteriovoraceae bacterium]|nr:RNA methyltransferase [Halobacteriovoraceae bacterium]